MNLPWSNDIMEKLKGNQDALRAEYNKAIANNARSAIVILQTLLSHTEHLQAIRFSIHVPVYSDYNEPEIGDLYIKFDKEIFPVNLELDEDECFDDDDFTPEWHFKELIERGMDVVNLAEISEVEIQVEQIDNTHKSLSDVLEGLVKLYGSKSRIIVTRSGVEVVKE